MLESFAIGAPADPGPQLRPGRPGAVACDRARGGRRARCRARAPTRTGVAIALAAVRRRHLDQDRGSALAAQALFSARLLAGEMPAEIEEVFAAAGAPLFPTTGGRAARWRAPARTAAVPCKHIAATFYLLAEAFDADPFEILHWRGRDRETLLANLRELRARAGRQGAVRGRRSRRASGRRPSVRCGQSRPRRDLGRFWVAPVPLPARPPTLLTDPQLILASAPGRPRPVLGGPALTEALRGLYAAFAPDEG